MLVELRSYCFGGAGPVGLRSHDGCAVTKKGWWMCVPKCTWHINQWRSTRCESILLPYATTQKILLKLRFRKYNVQLRRDQGGVASILLEG